MCHFSGDLSESVTYRELSAVVGFSPPLPSGQVRGVATEGRPRASHPSIVLLSKGGGRNGSGAACEGGPWQPGACRIVPGQRLPPRSLCRGPSAASVPPRPAGIWAVDGADGPGPQHGGSEVRPGAGPPGLRGRMRPGGVRALSCCGCDIYVIRGHRGVTPLGFSYALASFGPRVCVLAAAKATGRTNRDSRVPVARGLAMAFGQARCSLPARATQTAPDAGCPMARGPGAEVPK